MAFKSSKGRDIGKEVATWQSNNIGQGIGSGAGGGVTPKSFYATGGTITEPGDGYVYHQLPSTVGDTTNVFEVVQVNSEPAKNSIEIMLGGAGGGGGGGASSDGGGAYPGAGGSGGTVGAWSIPVTTGTYDQRIGAGGVASFGPNGPNQSGPGGGGEGSPGGFSYFRASGDPNRELKTPGGIGGNPGNPGSAGPATPGSNVAISWTWAGGTIQDNLPSAGVNGGSPNGGASGGGPQPSSKWWKPIGGSGGSAGGNGGGGRTNPNNEGGWRNPGNAAGNAGRILLRYPKVATYQPGIPGVSD